MAIPRIDEQNITAAINILMSTGYRIRIKVHSMF